MSRIISSKSKYYKYLSSFALFLLLTSCLFLYSMYLEGVWPLMISLVTLLLLLVPFLFSYQRIVHGRVDVDQNVLVFGNIFFEQKCELRNVSLRKVLLSGRIISFKISKSTFYLLSNKRSATALREMLGRSEDMLAGAVASYRGPRYRSLGSKFTYFLFLILYVLTFGSISAFCYFAGAKGEIVLMLLLLVCLILMTYLWFAIYRFVIYGKVDCERRVLTYKSIFKRKDLSLQDVQLVGRHALFRTYIKIKINGSIFYYISNSSSPEAEIEC
jgi:hypothetical protein